MLLTASSSFAMSVSSSHGLTSSKTEDLPAEKEIKEHKSVRQNTDETQARHKKLNLQSISHSSANRVQVIIMRTQLIG